ncbi:unnamed protein product [Lymnaea stagnalis]|uniref:RRM domain-containing protein n=1 Tax=Lymnaea stagnalis TaxID=6523 RepID=A0AAV2I8L6_LYMST
MTETVTKRFYIGGLASDVSADEITERFSRFGKVRNVSLKSRTDDEGNHIKSFAHLDMETDEAKMKKCFDTYQNTKWKGSVLKLQYAKESFLERLAKEREENDIETPPENPSPAKAPDKSDIKGPAVPGTPVPGKSDWVVAKYGRVLPVLKLKKSYKIKGVKHDPSKHCHAAKVFKDESDPVTDPSCNKLTWELNTPDSEITKKRKGEFPEDSSPVKRNKSSAPMSKTSQAASFNLTQSSFNSVSGQRKNLYKKEEDELEIVKIGQGHKTICKPLNNSNKFDSDIESDVEAKIIEAEPKKNKDMKKKNNNQVLKKNVVIAIKDGGEKQAPVTDLNTGTVEREVSSKNSSVKKAETNNNVLSPKAFVNDKINDFKCQSPQDETKIPEVSGFKILNPDTAAVKSPFLKEIPHKISVHLSSQKLPVGNNKNKNKFSEDDDPPRLIPEFRGLSMLPDFPSLQTADLKKSQEVTYSVLSDAVEKKISKPEGSHILTNDNSSKSVGKEKHSTDTEGEGDYDSASSADTDEIIARYKRTSQISGNVTPSSGAQSDAPTKTVNFSLLSKSPVMPKGIKNSFIGEDSYYLSEYSPGPLSDYSLPNSTPGVKTDESSYDSDLDSNDFELVVKKLSQKAKAVAPEMRSKPVKAEIREIEEVIESHESKSPHKNLSGPKQNNSALLHKKEKPQSSAEDVEKSKHQDIFSDKVKHAADNEKRLLAIREKLKLKDQQTSIMQKALQKVDSKENSGNRIVFSSDSESGASSDSDKDGIEELNIKSKIKKKQKLTLFENSSDDDSDSEAMFESKPHFEGKKGEKLMKLERKIGDSRFKLDAKFAESDSDEGSEKEKEEIDEAMDIDEGLQKEKAASLKVLENVIGKSTLDRFSEKIKRNTKHLIDMNAVRFDPTKILTHKEAPINDDKKFVKILFS